MLSRCNNYLQNLKTLPTDPLTDSMTDWLTGVGARRCYCIVKYGKKRGQGSQVSGLTSFRGQGHPVLTVGKKSKLKVLFNITIDITISGMSWQHQQVCLHCTMYHFYRTIPSHTSKKSRFLALTGALEVVVCDYTFIDPQPLVEILSTSAQTSIKCATPRPSVIDNEGPSSIVKSPNIGWLVALFTGKTQKFTIYY